MLQRKCIFGGRYNDIVSNYDVDSVMLGRGLLRNPNLVNEIKVEKS